MDTRQTSVQSALRAAFLNDPRCEFIKEWHDETCAYLIVRMTIQYFGVFYNGYCAPFARYSHGVIDSNTIDIYGGITFEEYHKEDIAILGFDCAHAGDEDNPNYSDIQWLSEQCESIARQIPQSVATWPDLSGNGHDLVHPDAVARPVRDESEGGAS